MGYCVYVLQCNDGTYYIGSTSDLKKRIEAHNGNKAGGAKYTRSRRPVKLVYSQEVASLSQALKMENKLKLMSRKEKIQLVNS